MNLPTLSSVLAAALLCGGCAHVGPPADASARLVCKDGTPLNNNGECGGRGGIDRQASATKSQGERATQASGAAAAGRPGEVWATPAAKTYLCRSDSDYGRSKEGQYMSESEAQAKGLHPARGRYCVD